MPISLIYLLAFLNGVVSVTENLRFDNGDKSIGLTDGSIPRDLKDIFILY